MMYPAPSLSPAPPVAAGWTLSQPSCATVRPDSADLKKSFERSSALAALAFAVPASLHFRKRHRARRLSCRAVGVQPPFPLDPRTVELHKEYHDKTIEYTVDNFEWVNNKQFGVDNTLAFKEQEAVWKASKARLSRWPRLEEGDMHEVTMGPPQRFCRSPDGVALGDPLDNVFVINLLRRPAKLKHVLHQLCAHGINATIVDAIDGDSFTCQEEVERLGARTLPGYCGHKNTLPYLTTGQLGCFMSHFTVWHHMVEKNISCALILEDDFDMQEGFKERLGQYLEEARGEDWNLMYVGRSPTEGDYRRASEHLVEPGYTLWTVGYLFRLEAAKALVEAEVEKRLAPLDHYFSVAMGKGFNLNWNEKALDWAPHIPQVLKGLAISPPLVMPYVGSMFLSDTAMLRTGTKFVADLPHRDGDPPTGCPCEAAWRAAQESKG